MTGVGLLAGGVKSRWAVGCVPCVWVAGAHCVSGHAFQVAQTARALHWIVRTLRASGFSSEADVPTLGEWVARPAAGLHPPVSFGSGVSWEERQLGVGGSVQEEGTGCSLFQAGPAPSGTQPTHRRWCRGPAQSLT